MPLADFSLYVLADAPATAATLNRSSVDIGCLLSKWLRLLNPL
jgi:hypothetical protein